MTEHPIINIVIWILVWLLNTGNQADPIETSVYPWEIIGESNISVYEGNSYELSCIEGTLSPSEGSFLLKNQSDGFLNVGRSYLIEIKQNGQWCEIDAEIDILLDGFDLAPGEECRIDISWKGGYTDQKRENWVGYGELPAGEYRILKSVVKGTWEEFREYVQNGVEDQYTYMIPCVFTIEP
ncbi:MAG: hypothetical protein IJ468_12875 [Lachnospiraceae bacterium]|nr:hypothetical protein [Lachnospiraceae bacterium]